MEASAETDITSLLLRWRAGDHEAVEALAPLIEPELRRIARQRMRGLRSSVRGVEEMPVLDTPGLVNEVYLRLLPRPGDWSNRTHFFAIAALRMRAICVDHARRALARKRHHGGVALGVAIEEHAATETIDRVDVLALEWALAKLEQLSPRQARIVTLRFYGGLTDSEVASVLKLSESTVRREWRLARAWLFRELRGLAQPPA